MTEPASPSSPAQTPAPTPAQAAPTAEKTTPSYSFTRVLWSWRRWWRREVVDTVDQAGVIERRRDDCQMTARYMFMIAMSAGIAVLGLLLSSPAVVIGAMLLSPLMGPIIGLGFALAIGDVPWLKESARSLAIGSGIAVLLCAVIVALSPIQTVTTEIAARTRPNLFDLLVAVFSALAGAYAMIKGREGTIVGVAIATALMPPLAVVGFGLATFNWTVFSGALMLYVTNLLAIALVAAAMARMYGFSTSLSDRNTRLQTAAIIVAFVGLAIPLGISLSQIGWEAQAQRVVRDEMTDLFDSRARISGLEIAYDPIRVDATVLTPELNADAEAEGRRAMERALGQPVNLSITQYLVGTSAQAAEEAQLAAAREQEQAASERAEDLADRLALVAGVESSEVLVDRERRRALVVARPLDGATLSAYRELERRIAATEPEWLVELRPPARSLPEISMEEGKVADASQRNFALLVWSGKRVNAPIILDGRPADVDPLIIALSERDVRARAGAQSGTPGAVTARWGAPDQ